MGEWWDGVHGVFGSPKCKHTKKNEEKEKGALRGDQVTLQRKNGGGNDILVSKKNLASVLRKAESWSKKGARQDKKGLVVQAYKFRPGVLAETGGEGRIERVLWRGKPPLDAARRIPERKRGGRMGEKKERGPRQEVGVVRGKKGTKTRKDHRGKIKRCFEEEGRSAPPLSRGFGKRWEGKKKIKDLRQERQRTIEQQKEDNTRKTNKGPRC